MALATAGGVLEGTTEGLATGFAATGAGLVGAGGVGLVGAGGVGLVGAGGVGFVATGEGFVVGAGDTAGGGEVGLPPKSAAKPPKPAGCCC